MYLRTLLLGLLTLCYSASHAEGQQIVREYRVDGISQVFSTLGEAEQALKGKGFFFKPLEESSQEETETQIIHIYSAPVADPIYSDLIYKAKRCSQPTKDFSAELEAAKEGARQNYTPLCGKPAVTPRTNWGTALAPVRGACGSGNFYPKVSYKNYYSNHYLSTTELNSRQYTVDYVAKVKDEDGNTRCIPATDGITVSARRTADCPSGYWAKTILPESSPYDTQIGTKCENTYTANIYEKITYSINPDPLGDDLCTALEGNPCNPLSGNKHQVEFDYISSRANGLSFYRTYNSLGWFRQGKDKVLGQGWKHNFQRRILNTENNRILENTDNKSASYPTKEQACTSGWDNIKQRVWNGKFSTAVAQYNSVTSSCNISFNNNLVNTFKVINNNKLDISGNLSAAYRVVTRPDGSYHIFKPDSQGTLKTQDKSVSLNIQANGYIYIDSDGSKESYSMDGKLIHIESAPSKEYFLFYNLAQADGGDGNPDTLDKVQNQLGEELSFTYSNGKLIKIITSDGDINYDINSQNLTKVTYPNASSRYYLYESLNFPNGLTGIIDENSKKYASWNYDTKGRALYSEHNSGVNRVDFTYFNDGKTTVTDALGAQRSYFYQIVNNYLKTTTITGDQCRTCGNGFMKTRTYDTNGFLNGYTDWKGNQTTIINNARGLPIQQIDAVGTAEERITTTVWHNTFNLPLIITEPKHETAFTYTNSGQILTRSVTDVFTGENRTTTYTYHPVNSNGPGLIASVDGPRDDINDITYYEYDSHNSLNKITNALGQITQIPAHDSSGRPLTIIDPNGVTTMLTWDLRGHLLSIETAGSTTTFEYDPVGQLIKATQADGSYLVYIYDDAHRLTGISDNADNKIKYELDKMGNRVSTSTTDTNGTISSSQTAIFDKLSRLKQSLGANGQTQTVNYDLNNNPLDSTDALAHQTQSNYDSLDRLIKSIDPDAQETNFEYDNQNNLSKVIDAKGLETTYTYNGFDEVTSETSPDTGTTTYTYDKAGNRTSMTDARGVTVNYTYDELNRLTQVIYNDSTLNITNSYDSGNYAIGRLSQIKDATGTTDYSYDAHGNVLSKILTPKDNSSSYTTVYSYNAANRLSGIIYPSGNSLQYQRAPNGEITQVTATINGVTQTLLSNAIYEPFGPLKSFTYGNGLEYTASFDKSWRLTMQSATGIQGNMYAYNTVNNLVSLDNTLDSTLNQSFTYDNNDRLSYANGNYGNYQYVFDVVGNRTQKTGGSDALDYTYALNSHHLESISGTNNQIYQYDAVGNTTDNGTYQFIYKDDNRLHQVMKNGVEVARYTYNAQGQRQRKEIVGNGSPTVTSSAFQNNSVYEDGETDTSGWGVYDNTPTGATIATVFDDDSNSNVIEFTGSATQNGYRLGHNNANHANAWGNTTQTVISWDSKYTESFVVYVPVQTTQGFRYLYYTPININRGINSNSSHYIHHGIGTNLRNGAWHTIARDLEADLQEFEPSNNIISVNGFLIRGSGRVDNISLLDNLPPPQPVPAQIMYEDGESGTASLWQVYDQTPDGAVISNVFDNDKGSNVIEFIGSTTQNGYRLGHNSANSPRAWNNTHHKTISWDSKFSESMVVYIATQTTQGFRYLYYTFNANDLGINTHNSKYIHHGINPSLKDGEWHTLTRNLQADLTDFEPGNEILSVNGFLIRGSGRVDNIQLLGAASSGVNTDYIYDQYGRLISEISQNKHKDYIHFNGQLFAIIENGKVYYYHNNHLGTPEKLTDKNQTVVWQASYMPYGKATVTTETVQNNIRLPGQYFDAETGLHYNYFRYYDAQIGRYVTSDPIGLAGGINTYGYVGGNPNRFVDPYGLAPNIPDIIRSIGNEAIDTINSIAQNNHSEVLSEYMSQYPEAFTPAPAPQTSIRFQYEDESFGEFSQVLVGACASVITKRPRFSGKNPPINQFRQILHTNGTSGKSQFKNAVDADNLVKDAWRNGVPQFNKNGKFIGKVKQYNNEVGTQGQMSVSTRFSKKHGVHGFPSNKRE